MQDTAAPQSTIVPAHSGRVVSAFGEQARFLLTGAETGGRYTQWEEVTPPGGGPPPHYHENEDEWFFVLEGTVSFFRDGEWQDVQPGGGAFFPKGVPHTFKNNGSAPLRLLITTAPSGFEIFFERCAAEFAKEGGPDMERVLAISAEHGIRFLPG